MIGARLLFQRCCNRYALEACVKHRTFNTSSVLCKKAPPVSTEVTWPERPQRRRRFIPQAKSDDRGDSKPGGSVKFPDDTDEKEHERFNEDEDLDDDWEYSANDTIDQISQELPDFQLSETNKQSTDENLDEMSSVRPSSSMSALHDEISNTSFSSVSDNFSETEKGFTCVCGQTFATERGMKIHRGKMKCLFKSHTTSNHEEDSRESSDNKASAADPLPGNILGDLEYLFGESDHKQVDEEELLEILVSIKLL